MCVVYSYIYSIQLCIVYLYSTQLYIHSLYIYIYTVIYIRINIFFSLSVLFIFVLKLYKEFIRQSGHRSKKSVLQVRSSSCKDQKVLPYLFCYRINLPMVNFSKHYKKFPMSCPCLFSVCLERYH